MTATPAPPLRFLARFIPAVRSGRKTMTTRPTPRGAPGDVLQVADENNVPQDFSVRLTEVRQVPLSDVATAHYAEEGFGDPEGFVEAWAGIYGAYDPAQTVFVHRFEVVRRRYSDEYLNMMDTI